MDLFENLQLYAEANDSASDNFNIINKIKNYFKQYKDNKKIKAILSEINSNGGTVDAYFEKLVPARGKADTKAGELIRALMKILYRDYNDGDIYFVDYGIETCGSAASYLVDKGFHSLVDFAKNYGGDEYKSIKHDFNKIYSDYLQDLTNEVIAKIQQEPELLIEPNSEDMHDWPSEDWQEFNPTYEYEVEFSDRVQFHLDNGDIDISDVEYEISTWQYCDDISQDYWGILTISNLNEYEFSQLVEHFYEWMETYGETLDEEYGAEDVEYWEDDEEEENY